MSNIIEIGILGMGNIGSEFVEILLKQTSEIEQASNKKIHISKILVSTKSIICFLCTSPLLE